MGGLIPLLLPAANNRSAVSAQATQVKRPVSLMTPHVPSSMGHRRQQSVPMGKAAARLSITTPASPANVPETQEDWRDAINEVKRKYISRKYRTCSARCSEILDNLKDTSNVETLHLIYLHFYAASSSEMCARPLSQSSAYRTKLLDDARDNYDKASALIKKAEDIAVEKSRSGSSLSVTPSLSSSSSASPRSSTICTSPSTPRDSISSAEDLNTETQPAKPKKKKKVSFSSLPGIDIPKYEPQAEPHVRPDSPTLGWAPFGHGAVAEEAVVCKPMAITIPKAADSPSLLSPILKSVPEKTSQNRDSFDLESFLQTRSINRIISQLSALRSQVAWHRDNIDALLTESEEAPEIPETPSLPEMPSLPGLTPPGTGSLSASDGGDDQPSTPLSAALTPHTLDSALSQQLKSSFGAQANFDLTSARLSMFGDAWERTRSGSVCSSNSGYYPPPRAASQMSMRSSAGGDENLQKRIEKLRANGWQRKRFDSRRYEALREQVLSELGP
ncbi:hypothetical protein PFICI_00884 [Pestalotiopsis fici W106-1]|uniref:Uncharacterized protein n=1 Tax=Pestalotiopsis fici (strain W106-1 / CGMCC3.15140) TaxID=1229662 RepID=W3XP50_PESFW|nr:uncharacterized protein PFICI_00884 [Pestalotiopsis fici W106-1]ETS87056.1 hypothetical protein PFICI_00884 [Pestalotiopsis fici W106-1]